MGEPKGPKVPLSKEFGRYELLLEMAKGGMATLFLARLSGPQQFEKLVALKRIHDLFSDEDRFTKMFLDEAHLTAKIHHPNVATVFDMGEVDGHYYIAMEYVHGLDLSKVVRAAYRQKRGLDWPEALRLVADTAAGLHAAHELKGADGLPMGVVHRDVSPQNILVSFDGHVKVVDFGIAYAAERLTTTATGTIKGKAAYMSPEQVSGKTLDRRSDVFSLGIILWEEVLMRRLFREDNDAATILRISKADVPHPHSIRPELPDSLVAIMLKALTLEPEDRFQTAGELEEALNRELMRHDKYVAASHIGAMMADLFHDQKRVMDEQIRNALEVPTNRPMKAIGLGPPTDASETALGVSSVIGWNRPGGLSRASWVGVAVTMTLVLIVLYFIFGRDKEREEPRKKRTADAAMAAGMKTETPDAMAAMNVLPDRAYTATPLPPRRVARPRPTPMRPKRVTIRLTVLPDGISAKVSFRGKTYAGATFRQTIPATKGTAEVVIRAPGYTDKKLEVATGADLDQTVRLALKPAPPMARRRPWGRRRYRPRRKRPRPNGADLVKTF